MRSRRRTVWLRGLALLALPALGLAIAFLWPPPPSEAEAEAALMHAGMTCRFS